MQTEFNTISGPTEGFVKEKNSKFYSYAFPVKDKEQIKIELNLLKEMYPDANHHCYAYILGVDGKEERANDDGEPSSSAGKPILRQILSRGVTQTLVVVVRYFGGKKLGVPGLIHAYGDAAKEALQKASTVTKQLKVTYQLSCAYGEENQIYRIVKRLNLSIKPLHGTQQFECEVTLPLIQEEEFTSAFKDLHKIEFHILD